MPEEKNRILYKEGIQLQARVIKNSDVNAVSEAKNIIEKAHEIAEKIKQDAHQQAKKYIEETRLKTQKIIEETTQKAKEQEKAILADQHKRAAEQASAEVMILVTSLREKLENSHDLVSKIIFEVCQKVLGKIDKSELFLKLIQTGIADLQGQTGLIIRVCPQDESFIRNAIEEINSSSRNTAIERLELDGSLSQGDCHILSEGGLLDISLVCQLSNIVEELSRINVKGAI